ncbi:VanZ family protein [Colwellia sp. 1_MG-2023]|uniref:VanZ family protein n=1 Tax=Colwellia sp. 1_MG-2023 TaxID=3062649 RepID=UPI0026E1512F|nr:VanZ family protein [Colwellia sp. 1_MG-2023]MDO6444553.1 VanZ family protein [Colwellia sp. 1_MG-2023]
MKTQQRLTIILFVILTIILLTSAFFEPLFIIEQSLQIDTLGHFLGFYCLTWFLHKNLSLPLVNICLCMIFYGAVTELSQLYLGFRKGEVSDFVADVVGITLYMAIVWLKRPSLEKEPR